MPIYEFYCNKCEKNFEYLVIGSDKPKCPDCEGRDINRLLSKCGFVSKGQGGETTSSSASNSSCSSCSSTNCSSCGI